jgi:hypothetical protein
VLLDVGTHARLAAAAALRGVDRSTYAAGCIKAGLTGIIVVDKQTSTDHGELAGGEDRETAA